MKSGNPPFFPLAYLAQEVLLEVGDEGIFCKKFKVASEAEHATELGMGRLQENGLYCAAKCSPSESGLPGDGED